MPAPNPPNLLIILTDQLRFDALSAHGGAARTPHLDALAAGGADLLRHYAQSPVCAPSRATLFTGRLPGAHGVLENSARLNENESHVFKVLQKAGYWLAYHGKNHLLAGGEMAANFQRFTEVQAEVRGDPVRAEYVALEQESLDRLSSEGCYASAMFHDYPDEVTTTGVVANDVLASLACAPGNQPWCTVASFFDPHVPHLAPRRFARDYPPGSMTLPPLPEGDLFEGKPGRLRIKYHAQGSDRATDADKRHYLSVYAGMVAFVDDQVGRILATLRSRTDAERTIVVFTSDHGDFAWHHGLCKKDLVHYEDLLHVPAVLHWPGRIVPQAVGNAFTEHADLMPTLLELAGLDTPAGCQGESFAPLLRGEVSTFRTSTFAEVCFPWMRNPFPDYDALRAAWESNDPAQIALRSGTRYNVPGDHTKAVRTAGWSYLWYIDGFEELYDLSNDPGEWLNLAIDPGHIDSLEAMRCLLAEREALGVDARDDETIASDAAAYADWISLPAAPLPVAER